MPVIIITALAMLSAILLCFLVWNFANGGCGYSSRTITPKQGDFDAVIEERCCGWGGGCVETVKLHERSGWGLDTKIFAYNPSDGNPDIPWTHDPIVVWLNAKELEIAVDRLDKIHTQLEKACGIKVTYRIGFVDSQFERPLALEGKKVIGFLKIKLMDAQDDSILNYIVYVLKEMTRLETYDVAGDEELMRLVDERVKGIKDPHIKEITEQELVTMRERASWNKAMKKLREEPRENREVGK